MTDTPETQLSDDTLSAEWGDDTEEFTAEVQELFVTLGKALRAFQLYDENNPVYNRFVSTLRKALAAIWERTDKLTVHIEEEKILLEGAEVYSSSKRADSLAFLFFKDGIREITMMPGLERDELTQFLDVLNRARNVRSDGDDLLTILWEEDLSCFDYKYQDFLAEGLAMPESGAGSPGGLAQAHQEEVSKGGDRVSEEEESEDLTEAFNPTLYAVNSQEAERLREELEAEGQRDLRGEVLAALYDRLEEPENRERQLEIIGILRALLPNFLSRGQLQVAAELLRVLRELLNTEGALGDDQRSQVDDLFDELSGQEVIDELVRALMDGAIDPSLSHLASFLGHLREGALSPLLKASVEIASREIQPILSEAIHGIADRHRRALLESLDHEDSVVVVAALALAGRMQLVEVAGKLGGLLRHADAQVRVAAIGSAVEMRASAVAGHIMELLSDGDGTVRVAAVRAVAELRYTPAAVPLKAVITGKAIRRLELSEKIAFFESYGVLGGAEVVPFMDGLLSGKGFLGRREPAEIRACAALALGKAGTPEARAALEEAAGEDDPIVRSAVGRALREEEEDV